MFCCGFGCLARSGKGFCRGAVAEEMPDDQEEHPRGTITWNQLEVFQSASNDEQGQVCGVLRHLRNGDDHRITSTVTMPEGLSFFPCIKAPTELLPRHQCAFPHDFTFSHDGYTAP